MGFIDHFDKIFIIHCLENTERQKNIEFQLSNLSQETKDKIEIHKTCYFPFSKQAQLGLLFTNKTRYISSAAEYNLVREFYQIIKTSYLQGYKNILIFEDDFSLIKEEILELYFDKLPEDWDILQLSILCNEYQLDYEKLFNSDLLWIKKDFGAWSNNGLGLSRSGMKYWIDFIDKEFVAADIPIHESKNNLSYYGKTNQCYLNHYVPNLPLVYITGEDSSVQSESKTDLYKIYENLNKEYYNIYQK